MSSSKEGAMNQKSKSRNRRRIAIACQGGGSHTAFTAGALKTILEKVRDEQRYEIVALSGTSGGAICAFLAWYALLQSDSGKEVIEEVSINKAIEALHRFWTVDNTANWKAHDPLGSGWDALTNDSLAVANLLRQVAEAVSGVGLNAELNPYRYHDISNYWRDRLKRTIEKRIRKIGQGANRQAGTPDEHPKLFVGAINTLTGEFVVFKSHKKEGDNFALNDNQENLVSVDAVLASAAIPVVFEATRTGEAVYWDPACLGNERPYRTYVKEGV
jgi:NTE family protein